MGITLHKRVDKGQQRTTERQIQGQGVGEQHHHQKRHQAQPGKQSDGLPGADPAGGERAVFGAFDVAIPVPVGKIVDGTARGPHEKYAQGKDQQVGK